MEVGTGLALLGSAKLVAKLRGPTADYIGSGVKTWTEKRVANVKNIFAIASNRIGPRIEEAGQVPPKVLKGILEDGSFCDDSLAAEYFGGVLASSRSGVPRDDRGAYFIALISKLSTYQIRAHYVIYHMVKQLFDGSGLQITKQSEVEKMRVFVPFELFGQALDFSPDEVKNFEALLTHILTGLGKENLIANSYVSGSMEFMQSYFKGAAANGLIFQPTLYGALLFLWAYGEGLKKPNSFLDTSSNFPLSSGVSVPAGYQSTNA